MPRAARMAWAFANLPPREAILMDHLQGPSDQALEARDATPQLLRAAGVWGGKRSRGAPEIA